jgi:hypothetical protein
LRLGVDDVGVERIERAVVAVAVVHELPVVVRDAGAGVAGLVSARLADGAAGTHPAPVVLQPAHHAVGIGEVEREVVELAERELVEVLPRLRAVVRGVGAAVGAEEEVVGIGRVDRHRVEVAVRLARAVRAPGAAAVVGDVQAEAQQVDALVVLRIDADLREVERARGAVADALPGLAAVVRAEEAAFAAAVVGEGAAVAAEVGLDDGVEDARVLREEVEADAPGPRGQAAGADGADRCRAPSTCRRRRRSGRRRLRDRRSGSSRPCGGARTSPRRRCAGFRDRGGRRRRPCRRRS